MKLLLALDCSSASRTALDEVASRPWPAGTHVDALHVVEQAHLWETSSTAETLAQRGRDLLAGAVNELQSSGLTAEPVLLHGDPKRAILDRAAETHPDWIIVGANFSAATRFMMGNVASAVLHYAPCSVEVVRVRSGDAPKILLATDGSPASEAAARSIVERPWPAGTRVRVLTVLELVVPPIVAMLEPPFIHSEQIEEFRAAAMKRAEAAVQTAVGILAPAFPEVAQTISVLLDGPRKIVLDEANQWGADIIVLGSHGHKGMDRFLLGSVSQYVATHATCSVEIHRAK